MHPVLFHLSLFGHVIPFYTYGFLLGWAFFASAQTGAHLGALDGIDRRTMLKHAALVIVCGYFGSHLHYILTQPHPDFSQMLSLRYDGFTFYGAIIAGSLAGIPVARFLKIPYWKMSDAAAVAISVAHGIGRLGCFFRGCDYGVIATSGLLAHVAVRFPRGEPGIESPAWQDQVAAGQIPTSATESLPVVPTQLFEVAIELVMTIALWRFLTRKPRPRAGSAYLIYWVVYGILRVILEQLRGDSDRGTLAGVSTSTAIGLATSVAALLFLTVPPLVRLRPKRPEEVAREAPTA